MKHDISLLVESLLVADRLAAEGIVNELTQDVSPISIIETLIVPALEHIGRGWEDGSVALSQVYMGGRICEKMVNILLPPGAPDRKDQPRMALCVLQDHHLLGKQIVYSLLRAAGFELLDYGNISVDEVVKRVKSDGIKVLLISVLMLPSALKIRKVTTAFDDMGLDVKIVVGGAPFKFDDQLFQVVGADAMCTTASSVVPVIEKIMEVSHGN
ncbi:Methanogenic corrinoid protein MtbC1 [Desulfocicer vacuolatum DSM 3385]|uniref:Methanogenic corrinoid protein MtbC1 n=1 Tax=Desulfocicer vacuolatum DSM 3385 TaxID=1121400 RepID=A0A1W2AL39_9BACT|nr:cobalamin-dependent protein [Desulfocicer vacuolatum]SMC61260.1 Methanogenic corrinoid protein MtbC1 [Desulfocicer vacuolatum DSM 3385]